MVRKCDKYRRTFNCEIFKHQLKTELYVFKRKLLNIFINVLDTYIKNLPTVKIVNFY